MDNDETHDGEAPIISVPLGPDELSLSEKQMLKESGQRPAVKEAPLIDLQTLGVEGGE